MCGWWGSIVVRWSGCGIQCGGDNVHRVPSGSGSRCEEVCRFGGRGMALVGKEFGLE